MIVYSRKVTFIDLFINGIRCGNVGVLKQRLTEDGLHLLLDLCGIECRDGKDCAVYLTGIGEKRNVDHIELRSGKGRMELDIPLEDLKKYQYQKLFLHPAENSYAVGDLICLPKETLQIEEENHAEVENDVAEEAEPLQEDVECDKWEQIKKKYPILYPFKGQGPYVSIKPVDFQLLKENYRNLNSNTFLMHGFYRYRHMILGEYSMPQGTFFYVGVPGEFIKKEQSTAAMCGFEGYEHSGDLGYYLYRVEI